MTEDGHQGAADELRASRSRLIVPQDVRAYTELTWGLAFHLIAIGSQRRHRSHRDEHEGVGRWLRDRGHLDIADAFGELESLRLGRWYGRRGNGDAVARLDELLAFIEAWSVAA